MPKENTHLFFSDQLFEKITSQKLRRFLETNKGYYYFGSIFPDSFFYASKDNLVEIAHNIHGRDGNPTNEMPLFFLKKAKETHDDILAAFALGMISHCTLDIFFHPVVIYLTGSEYGIDKQKQSKAKYKHRRWETALDANVNGRHYLDRTIDLPSLRDSLMGIIAQRIDCAPKQIEAVIRKQIRYNRLFRIQTLYYLLVLAAKLPFGIRKENLALFYGIARERKEIICLKIEYRDVISGRTCQTSIKKLIQGAAAEADKRINAGFDYYQGRVSEEDCALTIKGESLETGKSDCPVSAIKYTL